MGPSELQPLHATVGEVVDGAGLAARAAEWRRASARRRRAAPMPPSGELGHPHALRHSCATALLRAGASLIDARDFLGHASITTTSIYLNSGPEQQEAAIVVLERGRLTLDADGEAA